MVKVALFDITTSSQHWLVAQVVLLVMFKSPFAEHPNALALGKLRKYPTATKLKTYKLSFKNFERFLNLIPILVELQTLPLSY